MEFSKFLIDSQEGQIKLQQFDENRKNIEFSLKYLKKIDFDQVKQNELNFLEKIRFNNQEISQKVEQSQKFIQQKKQDYDQQFYQQLQELKENKQKLEIQTIQKFNELDITFKQSIDATEQQQNINKILQDLKKNIDQFQIKLNNLISYNNHIKLEQIDENQLDSITQIYNDKKLFYEQLYLFHAKQEEYINQEIKNVKVLEIEQQMKNFKQFVTLEKIKQNQTTNKQTIVDLLLSDISEFNRFMPIINIIGNPDLKPRHLENICQILQIENFQDIKLNEFLNDDVFQHLDRLQEIVNKASSEASIEHQLQKIEEKWKNLTFTFKNLNDSSDRLKITDVESILNTIDDHLIIIQGISGSKQAYFIKNQLAQWYKNLQLFQITIEEWMNVQKKWVYLEGIFNSLDIQKQLPNETSRFYICDKFQRELMIKVKTNPNIYKMCINDDLYGQFKKYNKLLNEVLKSLEQYLETKKLLFPRFYFISNEEIVQILSCSKNPNLIQNFLKQFFENINRVKIIENIESYQIIDMQSQDPEQMPETVIFKQPIELQNLHNVELWLIQIEKQMKYSLYNNYKLAYQIYNDSLKQRQKWLLSDFPSQILLQIENIKWQERVTDTFYANNQLQALKQCQFFQNQLIEQLISLVKTDLNIKQRIFICNLLICDVYLKDVLDEMISQNVISIEDFNWKKILKCYHNNDNINVEQLQKQFNYGFEYLGCSPRLVQTKLTERCQITMTRALQHFYGGCSFGPAGTGKTETIKEISKFLGLQCLVFNCSEDLDFTIMIKFFKGIAQSGAWVCFDEFNRIKIDILSILAQYIQSISTHLKQNIQSMIFDGQLIHLNQKYGIFITMNPYAYGRTKIPDNLNSLFRPISMSIPDLQSISQILLFSYGFSEATQLGIKIVQVYQLCKLQLSQQIFYNFGLRDIKNLILYAEIMKREQPQQSEVKIIVQSLRVSNYPKLIDKDIVIFNQILKDLFPAQNLQLENEKVLFDAIKNYLEKNKFTVVEKQIKKIIQFYQTIIQRSGVLLIGQTLTGKSFIIETLTKALISLAKENQYFDQFQNIQIKCIYPKSQPLQNIYGFTNSLTDEWIEGIFTKFIIEKNESIEKYHQWINFDGPVDTLWMENLNTVLDDNRMLCLSNGQRIKIQPETKLIFEIKDVTNITPASISRCGVVYIDDTVLGHKFMSNSWIQEIQQQITQINNYQELFKDVQFLQSILDINLQQFNKFFEQFQKVILVRYNSKTYISESMIIQNFKKIFRVTFKHFIKLINDLEIVVVQDNFGLYFQCIIIYSIIWSFGILIFNEKEFRQINNQIRNLYKLLIKSYNKIKIKYKIFDYYIDFKKIKFRKWKNLIPKFQFNIKEQNIFVHTKLTVQYQYLIKLLVHHNENVLVTGPTGSSKTSMSKNLLLQLNKDTHSYLQANFTNQTDSQTIVNMFRDKISFQNIGLKNLKSEEKLVIFIDDINNGKLDKFNVQSSLEILRQIISAGGYHNLKTLKFSFIQDVNFFGTNTPKKDKSQQISTRLSSQFNILYLKDQNYENILYIYNQIITGFLQNNDQLKRIGLQMSKTFIKIYKQISKKILPTPNKFQYSFNSNDISKVFTGILQIDLDSVTDEEYLVKLYIHEILRVFYDRLQTKMDRDTVLQLLQNSCEQYLKVSFQKQDLQQLMFARYYEKNKKYKLIQNQQTLQDFFIQTQNNYNLANDNQIQMIFHEDSIQYLNQICRILGVPGGNGLFIGVESSGRNSLTQISTFIYNQQIFKIQITKNYNEACWKDDIKQLIKQTGVINKNTVFLIGEDEMILDCMIEDINNMLNISDLNIILSQNLIDEIILELKKNDKENLSDQILIQQFIQKVRNNLHIILIFSSLDDQSRGKFTQNPNILKFCTIIYFDKLQNSTLSKIAFKELEKLDHLGMQQFRSIICKITLDIHNYLSIQNEKFQIDNKKTNFILTTHYYNFINNYINLAFIKQKQIAAQINRYNIGFNAIEQTKIQLNKLQNEIIELQPQLDQQKQITMEALQNLNLKKQEAQETEQIYKQDYILAQKERDQVNSLKQQCQQDYDESLPILRQAQEAILKIENSQLKILKSYINPPSLVMTLFKACCLLFGYEENWENAKRYLLNDIQFIQKLLDYDVQNCDDQRFERLRNVYLKISKFNHNEIKKQSEAAATIYHWLLSINEYQRITRIFKPKEIKLKESQAQLFLVDSNLEKKNELLNEIRNNIQQLTQDLQKNEEINQNLKNRKESSEIYLKRAKIILDGLELESVRWLDKYNLLIENQKNMIGNFIIYSAFITYFGPYNQAYRNKFVKEINQFVLKYELPVSKNFNIQQLLINEQEIQNWFANDLPQDNQSKQNAIIIFNSKIWSLLVDSQGQAKFWLKKQYQENNLKIISSLDNKNLLVIQNCIQYGFPLIVEKLTNLKDPIFKNVLSKSLIKKQSLNFLKIGDTLIPYHENFELYIVIQNQNAQIQSRLYTIMNIISFDVTQQGLEENLLIEIIKSEKRYLEEKRHSLFQIINQQKQKQLEIENQILAQMEQQQGHFLENDEFIQTLDNSTKIQNQINDRIKNSEINAKNIEESRNQYRIVAKKISVIFFAIQQLSLLSQMYIWSLDFFIKFFKSLLINKKIEQEYLQEDQMEDLIYLMKSNFIDIISIGLLENHKKIFLFLISTQQDLLFENITDDQIKFFQMGNTLIENQYQIIAPDFVDPHGWKIFQNYIQIDQKLEYFLKVIEFNPEKWNDFIKNQNMEILDQQEDLSEFQKLIIIRIFNKNLIFQGVDSYIMKTLGQITFNPKTLLQIVEESNYSSPILFILSQGADPLSQISNVLQNLNITKVGLQMISLGKGQEERVKQMVTDASRTGDWVVVQNCHLSKECLIVLKQIIENFISFEIKDSFKLFLTSLPINDFPVSILQKAIKISDHAPIGMKQNISKAYNNLKQDSYELNSLLFKKLLFQLTVFHSVIAQRKFYGSIGWNISYDWQQSDFEISSEYFDSIGHLETDQIDFNCLITIIAQINYGGRVTDKQDMRLIISLLKNFINDEVIQDTRFIFGQEKFNIYNKYSFYDIVQFTENISEEENLELYGLSDNAKILNQKFKSNEFLQDIKQTLNLNSISVDNKNYEDKLQRIYNIINSQTMSNFQKYQTQNNRSIDNYRNQEFDRYLILFKQITDTLNQLMKATKGKVLMTLQMEQILQSIMIDQIPSKWLQYSFLSEKPLSSWLNSLKHRIECIKAWQLNSQMNNFQLEIFFFPKGFFIAIKQDYGRQNNISLDEIKINSIISNNYDENEIYITGLFLEGCKLDPLNLQLTELEPQRFIFQINKIRIQPCLIKDKIRTGIYKCPVYQTQNRGKSTSYSQIFSNFITKLNLPSDRSEDYWIQRGVALICQDSD